ncbi:putative Minor allergen Alt a [Quillaja saponaria]|uniref:NAD(P)H dehydrogenase (quinone) n=1 Tax=Quillaja saponaria TaxID=32244 RepID=A0AAD7KRJ9_QUISA|nr:putative Minor allergen Alt a [Quillaja saponaria]
MGKGGGCVPSKKKVPSAVTDDPQRGRGASVGLRNAPIPVEENTHDADVSTSIAIENAVSAAHCEIKDFYSVLFDVWAQITAAELVEADGLLFGFPTRYGCMAAQMKALFDSTGQLWKEQKLSGKPAGFFVSTGTQGGGQETTAWTAITQLVHHGMLFVPIGYTFGAGMFKMDSIRGGSPYGAGVFAGDGMREPSETELALAEHQGKYMAAVVKRLAQT